MRKPLRSKRSTTQIALTILLVISVSVNIIGVGLYIDMKSNLESRYNSLQNSYNTLQSDYSSLQNRYNSLESRYNSLQNSYNTLQSDYSSLQNRYNSLESRYNSLQNSYNTLQTIYNKVRSIATSAGYIETKDALGTVAPVIDVFCNAIGWLADALGFGWVCDSLRYISNAYSYMDQIYRSF